MLNFHRFWMIKDSLSKRICTFEVLYFLVSALSLQDTVPVRESSELLDYDLMLNGIVWQTFHIFGDCLNVGIASSLQDNVAGLICKLDCIGLVFQILAVLEGKHNEALLLQLVLQELLVGDAAGNLQSQGVIGECFLLLSEHVPCELVREDDGCQLAVPVWLPVLVLSLGKLLQVSLEVVDDELVSLSVTHEPFLEWLVRWSQVQILVFAEPET